MAVTSSHVRNHPYSIKTLTFREISSLYGNMRTRSIFIVLGIIGKRIEFVQGNLSLKWSLHWKHNITHRQAQQAIQDSRPGGVMELLAVTIMYIWSSTMTDDVNGFESNCASWLNKNVETVVIASFHFADSLHATRVIKPSYKRWRWISVVLYSS